MGGGVGAAIEVPLLGFDASLEREHVLIEVQISEPSYPMTYAEWMDHLK